MVLLLYVLHLILYLQNTVRDRAEQCNEFNDIHIAKTAMWAFSMSISVHFENVLKIIASYIAITISAKIIATFA